MYESLSIANVTSILTSNSNVLKNSYFLISYHYKKQSVFNLILDLKTMTFRLTLSSKQVKWNGKRNINYYAYYLSLFKMIIKLLLDEHQRLDQSYLSYISATKAPLRFLLLFFKT